MARSWSDAARAALDAYPWQDPREKAKAAAEAELVAFGEAVECDDLPLAVRQWLRRQKLETPGYVWQGESWEAATRGFERNLLAQVLAANGGNCAAAARALRTTPRIVSYKARKYGLTKKGK